MLFITSSLLTSFNICFVLTDWGRSVTIRQSQPKLVPIESRVDFNCSHDDNNMNAMLWYQQTNSNLINLIATSYGSQIIMEKDFKGLFEMTRKDITTGSLVLHRASMSDSAVYFCAACHTVMWFNFYYSLKLTAAFLLITRP